ASRSLSRRDSAGLSSTSNTESSMPSMMKAEVGANRGDNENGRTREQHQRCHPQTSSRDIWNATTQVTAPPKISEPTTTTAGLVQSHEPLSPPVDRSFPAT